jgi:glucokinase
MKPRRIVADVGGTNCRFGISAGPGDLSDIRTYPTAGTASFTSALAAYVADVGLGSVESWCNSACIAAAGPVDAGAVQLTNAAWSISAADVSQHLGSVPVVLVNDLAAVGLLLPHLQSADVTPLGGDPRAAISGNRIAVNVGTGFGAATAVRSGADRWAIAAGEAGHMSLAPATTEEAAVLRSGLTVEDILSGTGIGRLYATLAHEGGARRTAEDVFTAVATDPAAARTTALMARLLGRITGDLVLATASWEGAFLCGSVARAWLAVGDLTAFRASFEDKGPMRPRMSRVPTFLIRDPEPALLGLTHAEVPVI